MLCCTVYEIEQFWRKVSCKLVDTVHGTLTFSEKSTLKDAFLSEEKKLVHSVDYCYDNCEG